MISGIYDNCPYYHQEEEYINHVFKLCDLTKFHSLK